jgi:hypothetical protein
MTTPTGSTGAHPTVAGRFTADFPGERLVAVDRVDAMAALFDGLGHQRPATCGAYVLAYLLPAVGFLSLEGHDLAAEDFLAHLAGVVVEEDEVEASDEVSRRVASGELTEAEARERFGRVWYRFPVRSSRDPIVSGASAAGVARAVERGSGGRLVPLPVASRLDDGTVQLTADRWDALLDILAAHVGDWRWHAILNYETDRLLRPTDPAYTPLNLRAPEPERLIPHDDWGVGHFVGIAGTWTMSTTGRRWLLLFDTYKCRGFDGYEPQPAELMRLGLCRTDGRGGGMLVVVPVEVSERVAAALHALGLELRLWDNGSPPPEE